MISVEGYKAFRGGMQITPKNKEITPYTVIGDFLYKPDTKYWYGQGNSYPEDVCKILYDDTTKLHRFD